MVSLPTLSPIRASRIASEDAPGDGFGEETSTALNDTPNLSVYTTVDDALDLEANSYEDPAAITDADAFEDLVQNSEGFITTTLDQPAVDEEPDMPTPPEQESNGMEAGNPDTMPEVVIDCFPSARAGAPIPSMSHETSANEVDRLQVDSIWSPFTSQCDWLFAHWAKMRGPSLSSVSALLAIPEIVDKLNLSYRSVKELHEVIDNELPGCPAFQCRELIIGDERLEFYCRDVLECIRSLYGDPNFAQEMAFVPERHYTSTARTSRIYNEMYMGDWWWTVQEHLDALRPGGTIIPVIVSSDKTQLTLFRDKMAYPIYLTIRNIPKDTRRKPSCNAQILIGYIPTTKLAGISNKAGRRRALANLFHSCMFNVLGPISSFGETGVAMMSGDGVWRRCHPIFAVFVGDYPEQALVTCTFNGRCHKCLVAPGQLGEYQSFPLRLQREAIDTYFLADSDVYAFHLACREAGLKPVYHPFWETFLLADIFASITPDILHQMLQGMMKHLIRWLVGIFGPTAIDARCRAILPNHNILLFTKGITTLSWVSGHEHKKMCSILLGLIVDIPVPGGQDSSCVVKAVRALLDFLFLAQFQSHTSDTLRQLEECLSAFHNNKAVFVDLGIRENFHIPKLHSLLHYRSSIRLFGTTDNYNTEQSERLHIDLTKEAYRATNHKDEYAQMTVWLERREKVQRHLASIDTRQNHLGRQSNQTQTPIGRPCVPRLSIKMTQHPSKKAVSLRDVSWMYGALQFKDALADFIASVNNPGLSGHALHARAGDTLLPFQGLPVYHNIKFTTQGSEIVDTVHVRPEQKDSRRRIIPARFNTVLIRAKGQESRQGNKGYRIAQVRVVFQLPQRVIPEVFPLVDTPPPNYLAYVEWFTHLPATKDPKHGMYRVSRQMEGGQRSASVIPVDSIVRSIHLIP